MVEQAETEGWLEEIKPHDLKSTRGDRSNTIVEPWLTDQWYVSIEKLAKPAIEAVEDGRTEFVPAQYKICIWRGCAISRTVYQPSALVGTPYPCVVR